MACRDLSGIIGNSQIIDSLVARNALELLRVVAVENCRTVILCHLQQGGCGEVVGTPRPLAANQLRLPKPISFTTTAPRQVNLSDMIHRFGAHRARSTVLAMVIFQPRDHSLRPSPAAQRPRQAPCSPPPKNAPSWGDVSTTSTNLRVQINEREEQIKVKNRSHPARAIRRNRNKLPEFKAGECRSL